MHPFWILKGEVTGETLSVSTDQGIRDTNYESLASLNPVLEGAFIQRATLRKFLMEQQVCYGWMKIELKQMG